MTRRKISIIICSINAGRFARVCNNYQNLMVGHDFEIIGIHDAHSLAEGYNRGIQQSTGDIMIFSHDDILVLDKAFARKIIRRLEKFDLLGFVGTSRLINGTWFGAGQPHLHGVISHARPLQPILSLDVFGVNSWPVISGIKAIDGLCMIANGELARSIGFDAVTFDGFHLYDLDFSFSAYLAGYKLGICCDIPIIHESTGQYDEKYGEQARRFCDKHHQQLDGFDSQDPTQTPRTKAEGKQAKLPDSDALLKLWHPDILRRVTATLHHTAKALDEEHTPPSL
ncbi:glycosyltransferase [Quatrionicoccus australiensis]|uniref:glycosyltransferase n=1 Tax=Quatrionicoccus australiensis TaxID=138118 RepID=UPI001CF89873|nr:glycosyltransferase [Quatrionicoccus australiensis]UCV15987.1 hypothetical protein KI612_04590 [Quatrionicoccus australiensis]